MDHHQFHLLPKMIGDMAEWIDSFLEMINMLLNLLHFQRSGNWHGYLECIHQFLSYCFALNRQNYARNLSYFWVKMMNLKDDIPDAYAYLARGGYTGSLTGIPHSSIPMDQMIEVTVNRFSKTNGWLIWNNTEFGGFRKMDAN